MGCQKVNVLFLGLSEVYFACYNLFLQFLYYKRGNKRLKTVVSMQSCGAPYIESIVGPSFSKNQKRSSLYGFSFE